VRDLRIGAPLSPMRWSLTAAGAVVLLDQLTKWWVVSALPGDPIVVVDGFLELRYVTNPGASFGMLQDAGTLIALLVVAVVVFIVFLVRKIGTTPEAVGLGLVLGGAIGNLADRVFRGPGWFDGGVVDFVDFSFFPAFNVADSAITIGAGLILLLSLIRR
jgi:signal peptidase II